MVDLCDVEIKIQLQYSRNRILTILIIPQLTDPPLFHQVVTSGGISINTSPAEVAVAGIYYCALSVELN